MTQTGCVVFSFVNLTQPRTIWEEGLSMRHRPYWFCLQTYLWEIVLTDTGRPSPLWEAPFPRRGCGGGADPELHKSGESKLNTVQQGSMCARITLPALDFGCNLLPQRPAAFASPHAELQPGTVSKRNPFSSKLLLDMAFYHSNINKTRTGPRLTV